MDFNMIEIAEKLNRGEISPSDGPQSRIAHL